MKKILLGVAGGVIIITVIVTTYLVWKKYYSTTSSEEDTLPSVAQIITDYSPENGRSMQHLDELVMQGESSIAEVKPYITDNDPKKRWLAVYVIGRVSNHDTVQPLLPLLQDENEIVRISAAGTLANKGYIEALPALIAGLNSAQAVEYLHPQIMIVDFCQEVLITYTGQSFAERSEWERWWQEHQTTIKWNEAEQRYE